MLSVMGSVADDLRRATWDAVMRLSPSARVALAFRLGQADRDLLCAARGCTFEEAEEAIRRAAGVPRGVVATPVAAAASQLSGSTERAFPRFSHRAPASTWIHPSDPCDVTLTVSSSPFVQVIL